MALLATITALGACAPVDMADDAAPVAQTNVPEGVLAIADPSQDLTTVVLRPEDNCYWYQYAGPIETTFLPLKSRDGRPICAAASEA